MSGAYLLYFLDQMPPSNSRHTQIVTASFPFLSFIVTALELSPHILTRAHLQKKKVEEERSSENAQHEKATGGGGRKAALPKMEEEDICRRPRVIAALE